MQTGGALPGASIQYFMVAATNNTHHNKRKRRPQPNKESEIRTARYDVNELFFFYTTTPGAAFPARRRPERNR